MQDSTRPSIDWSVMGAFLAIAVVGIINMLSATSPEHLVDLMDNIVQPSVNAKNQALYFFLGSLVMIVVGRLDYRIWERFAYPLLGIGFAMLVGVLIFGKVYSGARRWVEIGSFRLQPSEPVKLLVILALAKFFHRDTRRWSFGLLDLWVPLTILGTALLLLFLEPDLGTGLAYVAIGFSMMIFAGLRVRSLGILGAIGLVAAIAAYQFVLHDYQKDRILTFLDPAHDPLGRGYHAMQSMIAVGSGRFLGKGYLAGSQSQLKFLPEQHTDFIFSVIAEEWGFVGCFVLILLFVGLLNAGLTVATYARDRFGAFITVGVVAMLFWQMFINISAVIGIMPITGITLPFMSYGGSSVLTLAFGVGLILSVSRHRFMF